MNIIDVGGDDMDAEERIRRALEECKKGNWVRNPFAGTFGDTAMVCIEMEDGSCRWKEIPMKRSVIRDEASATPAA